MGSHMLRDPSPDVGVDFAVTATASGQQCPDDAMTGYRLVQQILQWYPVCADKYRMDKR